MSDLRARLDEIEPKCVDSPEHSFETVTRCQQCGYVRDVFPQQYNQLRELLATEREAREAAEAALREITAEDLSDWKEEHALRRSAEHTAKALQARLTAAEDLIRAFLATVDDPENTHTNYCWWCDVDVNGIIADEKQPHDADCIGMKAKALLGAALASISPTKESP